MLKLYTAKGTCALASHIALLETGLDFDVQKLDFSAGEQTKPEYLAINPRGRVPALVTDKGVLTETPAVLLYLAQQVPAKKLAPLDDPFELARLQRFTNYLCSTLHVNHAHGARGTRWADQASSLADMKAKVKANMDASFQMVEQHLFAGPWVMGEQFTVADPYLYTVARWIEVDAVDVEKIPKVQAFRKRMEERPSVAKALAIYD